MRHPAIPGLFGLPSTDPEIEGEIMDPANSITRGVEKACARPDRVVTSGIGPPPDDNDAAMPIAYRGEPKTFDEAFSIAAIATSGPRFSARVPFQVMSSGNVTSALGTSPASG